MQEKFVLITGAAKRIGLEILTHLCENNWNVILHYCTSEEEAFAVKKKFGKQIYLWQQDLTKELDFTNLPQFDLLINNAAVFENDNIYNFSSQNIYKHLQINLTSPLLLTQHLINKAAKGNIINIVDYIINTVPENFFSYSLSKSALDYASKIVAKKCAPNFRCNTVALGYTLKNSTQLSKNFIEQSSAAPLQKPVKIKNLLQTIDFLLKNDAVTGETIYLDCGFHLKK